ncbi:MAG: hypothetical protein D6746_07545, partial [Bacteroidetes bacterium]
MSERDLLATAEAMIFGARADEYGHPADDFRIIRDLWSAYLKGLADIRDETRLETADVAALMVLLKLARIARSPWFWDSWVDIAGYAGCVGRIMAVTGRGPD